MSFRRLLEEDGARSSDETGCKIAEFLVGEGEHLVCSEAFLLRGDHIVDSEGSSSRTLGIREHMKAAHVDRAAELERLLEKFGCFAAHSHNQIDTDESVGDYGADFLNFRGIEGGVCLLYTSPSPRD